MSVSVDSGGGKKGKKALNADLNLVPYIDLLTCMVAFLLITAVWTQLARLEANQKAQGQAGVDEPPVPTVKITVVVNEEGYNLVVDQEQEAIAKKGDQYDTETLLTKLKKLKEAHPDKNDVQVASEDKIRFEVLVSTMDTALNARFADISLQDAGGVGL
jgi:biopolymer transport protein TolR